MLLDKESFEKIIFSKVRLTHEPTRNDDGVFTIWEVFENYDFQTRDLVASYHALLTGEKVTISTENVIYHIERVTDDN